MNILSATEKLGDESKRRERDWNCPGTPIADILCKYNTWQVSEPPPVVTGRTHLRNLTESGTFKQLKYGSKCVFVSI